MKRLQSGVNLVPVASKAGSTSELALQAGWNLVSLARQPGDPAPASFFSGAASRVFAYDACNAADPWKVWDPANPSGSDLAAISPKLGLWAEAPAAVTLPVAGTEPVTTTLHLCPGWNLIGAPFSQDRSVTGALASIQGKYARVFGYDAADPADPWEVYDVGVPTWANTLQVMEPGKGYWIFATVETDLVLSNDTTGPVVQISAPADLSEVTTLTNVVGTVSGELIQEWRLAYRALGDAQWTQIAAGTTPVVNGVLGVFDPTLLLNGPYQIELTATDANNLEQSFRVDVAVEGQQKIGNFTLTYSDLEIPLSGLPIQILRTYDSRDKRKGDFGIGWTLDIRQGSYKNNRQPGEGWQFASGFLPCQFIRESLGHTTTIRLSDREIYRFKLSLGSGAPTLGGCFAQARFDFVDGPVPGAALAILGNTQVLYQNGDNRVVDANSLEIYEPQAVRLTTRDGRIFDLTLQQGVTRLQDRNGNELSITASGITHSSGRTVIFDRDGQGRITRIADPEGESLTYEYDATGDLVTVTDRAEQATRFTYDSRHLLIDFEDSRGVKPVRNEYDAAGRLLRHIDAAGKALEYTHDLAARQEVITDRLGHSRLFEYDTRGNVVREVDAAGKEKLRTYDSNDRLLTETDPLGNETRFAYSPAGDVTSVTDPLGHATTYTYNAQGQVLTTRDSRGKTTEYAYDSQGNLLLLRDASGGEQHFTYDVKGNLKTETDPENGVTSYEYDTFGNLLKKTDALGHEASYTYDATGNRLSETTSRTLANGAQENLTTTFRYDTLGRLVETIDSDGSHTRSVYDVLGQVTESIDPLDRKTTFRYDALGRQVETVFPDGTSEKRTYDAEGRQIRFEDRAGRATTYVFDPVGRLLKTTYPDGMFTENVYDDAGRLMKVTDARRNEKTHVYDKAGRRTRTVDALGGEIDIVYDEAGNQIAITDPNRTTTRFEYDELNRLIRTMYPDGTERRMSYNRVGQRTAETDPAGRTTRFAFDLLGRLLTVTDALGQVTRYVYDEVGNRVSQTDANQHTTRFEYDASSRLTKRILPDGATEEMVYDEAGNMLSHKDFAGRLVTHAFDVNHRLTQRSYPDGSAVTFAYTATGRRERATDQRGATTYAYDNRDRLVSLTYPDGRKLAYAYDANGNRIELTAHVGGQVLTTRLTYDALNRLDQVTDPRGRIYDYGYDASGNRTSLLYPNAVETTYRYDSLNRLKDLTTKKTGVGQVINSYAYTLGPAGNRNRVDEHDGTSRVYGYDELYRLTAEAVTGGSGPSYQKAFTYDAVGNRRRQTHDDTAGSRSVDYPYDDRDRLLTDGAVNHTWDVNGNLVSKTGQGTYTWDFDSRLQTASLADGTVVTHFYDPDGVRVRTEMAPPSGPVRVTDYLVDTSGFLSQTVAETDGNGNLIAFYVRGDDLLAVLRSTGDRFYHMDGLGSVRALTNESGEVTDRYTFTAFGELLSHQGEDVNAYLFAGEPLDPNSGFYYLRARWMDPRIGRFVSMDPFGGYTEDPVSLHKYLYANAEPVAHIDPTGRFTMTEVNVVMREVATLSRITVRFFNALDKARGFIDAINTITGLLQIIQSGNYQQFLAGAAGILGSNFSASDVVESLSRNLPSILSRSFPRWSAWLVLYGSKVKGLALYLPNPGLLPRVEIPSGLKIGRFPVTLIAGGKSKAGSLIGVGFVAPGIPAVDKLQQMWRMDFHPFHFGRGNGSSLANPAKEIAVWLDYPFHYHVLKPVP